MKALVLVENTVLELQDIPLPERIEDRSYMIRISACGICGSDIHRAFQGGAYHYPLVMGHECSGVIEDAFPHSKLQSGQRVTVFPLLPCRSCKACQIGEYAQCSRYDYFGSRRDGAFAEFLSAPEENCFLIPEHVDTVHAAMTEPCAVALHGIRKLSLHGGETAAVYGAGPIGNMAAQWLRLRGCDPVVLIDVEPRKLETAEVMGFSIVNAGETDPVSAILDITRGNGAEAAVEACGLPLTYVQAIQSTARSGQILFMGNISGDLNISQRNVSAILRKELTLTGTWNSKITPSGSDDWSTVLQFLDDKIHVSPLISHTLPLEAGASIFHRMSLRKEFFSKVILTEKKPRQETT